MKRPVFLSASVPNRGAFANDFDPLAIREAILALVVVTLRERPLVFGGHPAISPLVEHAARSLGAVANVHIYQSRFFEDRIPEVAKAFENFHWTNSGSDESASLALMRQEMLSSWEFGSAVFVAGMDGVFREAELFGELHADKPQVVLGSTGGASAILLQNMRSELDEDTYRLLQNERRYRKVFRQLLPTE